MLTTFNFRAQPGKEPLYRQLADYFRQEIRQQHLVSQDFLPSIRKLTRDLKLSRTGNGLDCSGSSCCLWYSGV